MVAIRTDYTDWNSLVVKSPLRKNCFVPIVHLFVKKIVSDHLA